MKQVTVEAWVPAGQLSRGDSCGVGDVPTATVMLSNDRDLAIFSAVSNVVLVCK